jgi:NTE family protein
MTAIKTALILGGGGSRGSYQVGVWKALRELGIEIDMVAGTSVGAINGISVAMNNFEQAEALWLNTRTAEIFDIAKEKSPEKLTEAEEAWGIAREMLLHGGAESTGLMELLKNFVEEESFRKSSIEYGLVTTEIPGLKGHYLFKDDIPKGKLFDYVVASASCFPAAHYHLIDNVKFIDGAYTDNLPVGMAMKKKASRIIAVDLQGLGMIRKTVLRHAEERADEFIYIKSKWDLGNILAFETARMERNMRLGYLDAMKAFNQLDGNRFTFKKGAFTKKNSSRADAVADAFGLDPLEIYDEKALTDALAGLVVDAQVSLKRKPTPFPLLSEDLRVVYIALRLRDSRRENLLMGLDFLRPYVKELLAADFILRACLLQD